VVIAFGMLGASAIGAQELPFQREYPRSDRSPCSAQAEPRTTYAEARAQASELTSSSDQ
jgi:hypothetical protein